MNKKEEYLSFVNHDITLKKSSEIINLRYGEFLRITNHELLSLFWEIGIIVKNNLRFESIDYDSQINGLSKNLKIEFGSFFYPNNIKQMVEFSTILPDIPSFHEFALISWPHIQVLLSEKTLERWKFYLNLILEKNLSPSELAEQISCDLFENSKKINYDNTLNKKKKKNSLQTHINISHYQSQLILQNFFSESLLSTFEKLMKPKRSFSLSINNIYTDKELLYDLSLLILTTQTQHSRRLNSRFNMFLYEISDIINEAYSSMPIERKKSSIEELSYKLSRNFGSFFNKNLLSQISKCIERIPEILIFIRIANLITWEHLLILLPIKEIEIILFYARITADKGLTVSELTQAINDNVYEKADEAIEIEKNRIDIIKSHTSTTIVKKEGNNITKMTEQVIDFGKDIHHSKAVTNIFENRYFVDFMTTFQYYNKTLK